MRDSNSQDLVSKTNTYANSVNPANLATRRRIDLLCPARQAGIMTIILTSQKLVGEVGVEPTMFTLWE